MKNPTAPDQRSNPQSNLRPRRTTPFLAISAALLGLAPTAAMAEQIEAGSKVSAALVYPRGATIERLARFDAPAGRHEVMIADLPVALDKDSIRVAATADLAQDASFEILGVSHKIRKPRVEPLSEPERQKLLDQIKALNWQARAADDAIAEAKARLEYMASFRAASVGGRPPHPWLRGQGKKGQKGGPQATGRGHPQSGGAASLFEFSGQWPEAWALISSESAASRQALRTAEREREQLTKEIDGLRDKLEKVGPPPPARGVLTVSIRATAPIANGALKVSYLTTKANWTPLYDLKLSSKGVDKPGLQGKLTLIRRASVTQRTGEEWRDVTLRLSSARPRGRVAALTPRSVQAVLQPLRRRRAESESRSSKGAAGAQNFDDAEPMAQMQNAPAPLTAQKPLTPKMLRGFIASESDARADFSGAGVVYNIEDPTAIPGDGEARQVRIGVEEAEVDLVARALPARDETAYLYALHKNLKAPLLRGRASIYRDGVFYGQTHLKHTAPGDETALPFGPLDEVKVSYRVINRSNRREGLISTSNKREARFEFAARNLGATARKITLFDALPYTESGDITVRRTGLAPTEKEIEGRRGVLAWTFELSPGAEKTVPFGYDLSWPEGRNIRLRR